MWGCKCPRNHSQRECEFNLRQTHYFMAIIDNEIQCVCEANILSRKHWQWISMRMKFLFSRNHSQWNSMRMPGQHIVSPSLNHQFMGIARQGDFLAIIIKSSARNKHNQFIAITRRFLVLRSDCFFYHWLLPRIATLSISYLASVSSFEVLRGRFYPVLFFCQARCEEKWREEHYACRFFRVSVAPPTTNSRPQQVRC